MIERELADTLKRAASQLPVVALLGPRQSGKTTLARATFPYHTYLSCEDLDRQAKATNDPRGFLEEHKNPHGIILDEVHNVPALLHYIQTYVDLHDVKGYFVLTGSQDFLVNEAVMQMLAGRMAILTLLPLSITELNNASLLQEKIEDLVFWGGYPRLYANTIDHTLWYSSYVKGYIECDVRQVIAIKDLRKFKLFVKMCAGRVGQLLNVSSLADDCGITYKTAESWLSVLEACYIIFLLNPHYKNFGKRLTKSSKLYFYDTGLACFLLDIEKPEHVVAHFARGALVENLIIADLLKQRYNTARMPALYFWRDHHGREIDCIIEQGDKLFPIEIKAGRTVNLDYFKNIRFWQKITPYDSTCTFVVYAGSEDQQWKYGEVISWRSIKKINQCIYG